MTRPSGDCSMNSIGISRGNHDRVVAPVLRALTMSTPCGRRSCPSSRSWPASCMRSMVGRGRARSDPVGGAARLLSPSMSFSMRVAPPSPMAVSSTRQCSGTRTQMPKDLQFELLLNIAPKAWEATTGKEWDLVTDVSYETYSNRAGWPPADPEPEVPHARPRGQVQGIVRWEHGKHATRRLIRALIKGEIEHPVLSAHLAEDGRVLVMTPGSGVEPPHEPTSPSVGLRHHGALRSGCGPSKPGVRIVSLQASRH